MAIFNQSKKAAFNPQEINILNSGTKITGDLVSEGDLRIDGSVTGNVEVKAKLVLGVSGNITGNIKAQNCDVSGLVKGNISVAELLTIKSSAKIVGDISCSKLVIEAGAEFNGKSTMSLGLIQGMNDIRPYKNNKASETKTPVTGETIGEKAAV